MSARLKLFCLEYLVDLNPRKACERVGIPHANTRAYEYLQRPEVQAFIEKELEKRAARLRITADMVVEELAKLAFSNMADYSRVDANGDRVPDLENCTREQLAAVTELQVEQYVEGRGDDARTVKKTKFKLAAKREALVDIGKHLGMFKERVEISGPNGGAVPLVAVSMSPKEAAEAYARSLVEGPPALVIEHEPSPTADAAPAHEIDEDDE